jgi:hypothetical protein
MSAKASPRHRLRPLPSSRAAELPGGQAEPVAGRSRFDRRGRVGSEGLAQARDEHLELRPERRGGRVLPQRLGEVVHRDLRARPQQEQGEDTAPLRTPERQRPAASADMGERFPMMSMAESGHRVT